MNTASSEKYLAYVRKCVDRVLEAGQDHYGQHPSPLLADGFDVRDGSPTPWVWGGKSRIPSNLANQQHLLRTLIGLSELTGEPAYRERGLAIAKYALQNLTDSNGLLSWGGHVAWDLKHSERIGHAGPERFHHELKRHYPAYEILWQADAPATVRYVEALWNAQIQDWQSLDLSRHGVYDKPWTQQPIWSAEYGNVPVFFVAKGLSFANAGSDLFYAAATVAGLASDPQPMAWAKRLAHRYIETRDPVTGLGGYQYSQVENDRAQAQFGPEFGPNALEGTIMSAGRMTTRYGSVNLVQMQLADQLGEPAQDFARWAHEDLIALATHAYNRETGMIQPMFTDGRRLGPEDVKRPGYYKPSEFAPWTPRPIFFRTYAAAWRQTRNPLFWDMARRIGIAQGLGDLQADPQSPVKADAFDPAKACDMDVIQGLLDLHQATEHPVYLEMARALADVLIANHWHHGVFMPSADHRYARVSPREMVVLLHLAAAEKGLREKMPPDPASNMYWESEHETHPLSLSSKHHRVSDNIAIYDLTV